MHEWFSVELTRERNTRLLAEAEERRLVPRRPIWTVLRARVARRLFQFAVALEKEETWQAVWERLEAPRHP